MNRKNKNIDLISVLQENRKIKPSIKWQIDTRNEIISYTQNTHSNPQLATSISGIIKRCNNIKHVTSFAMLLFIVFSSFVFSSFLPNGEKSGLPYILQDAEINEEDSGIASFVLTQQTGEYTAQENDYSRITQPDISSANDSFQDYIGKISQLNNTTSQEELRELIEELSLESYDLSRFMGLSEISRSTAFEYAFRMMVVKKLDYCNDALLRNEAELQLEQGTIQGLISANEYIDQCLHQQELTL